MTNERQSKDYVSGVPELLILRLLAEQEMYGYELVQSIRTRSAEVMEFGEGVIYPLLHGMQRRRLLATRREQVNGRARVYYRLTSRGQKRLEAKMSEWKRISNAIRTILDGQSPEQSPA